MNLPRFILIRVLQAVPVIFLAVSLAFIFVRLAPGSPFALERGKDPAHEARMNEIYGLDGTLAEQFFCYWSRVLRGDLGMSTKMQGRSVLEILAQGLPVSALLGAGAFCLAVLGGVTLGTLAAVHRGSWQDRAAMFLATLGITLPAFITAPLLILVFALWLPWLPAAGWGAPAHLVLPTICLALPYAAYLARLTRGSLIDVLSQGFIRTATAKGAPWHRVVGVHGLKIALLPVLSFCGPLAAHILTGSLVVESIFNIPGIGGYFVNSVLNKDAFLTAGVVILYSSLLVGFNLLVDILYAWLDPRIRQV